MFEIGDKIVYPIHGAGVIVDIETKVILGKKKEYYVLKIPVNEMKVLVPLGSMDSVGIREIKTPEEMDKVLDVLRDTTIEKMPTNWNRRYRFHQDKIKTGDLEEIAKVIKNLECLDREKSLSTGERKILNNARQIILSEMVLVYDKSYDEVVKLVDETMEEGCLKGLEEKA
ncbi:MAG: CarD family transcriptional regulator [Peptoniphilus sp.]|nr:CarD family transcriptional regulator [Peptoniphilus sp.]MDD7362581.1 CarD family transcriptional regulator [Bacillota bacterium]MDY6045020.1 CarD family transcriptional regulator [Peptoniphilus sp.]